MQSCDADQAACDELIRTGSKSFFAASLLLPRRVREPALALYAFCRLADDAVDLTNSMTRLVDLQERLDRIYAGSPADVPADRVFALVVSRHRIPRSMPELLLEGFEWDLQQRRYRDLTELSQYAARVAGSVGTMMACLMDTRASEAIARANDLGVAMQLTNIARDVGEDARAGRLYLPVNWLRDVEIEPNRWLREPKFSLAIGRVVSRLLAAADVYYARAEEGIRMLPRDCQPGIRAAARLYAEIGHELRRRGCDSVTVRTVVPTWRKLVILADVAARAGMPRPGRQAAWVIELFERLTLLERSGDSQRPAHSKGQ
jgi:15-cis-phytoene synthase